MIGLVFGAFALMLWIGRARLGFIYLAVAIVAVALYGSAVISGQIAPLAIEGFDLGAVFGLVISPVALVAIIHALLIRRTSLSRPWYSRWYVALFLPLVGGWAIALFVRMFLFQPFNIPAGSMYPALRVGDYVFVSKTAYGYSKYSFNAAMQIPGLETVLFGPMPFDGRVLAARAPERGDVAVFKLPRDNATDYVKRIIGLPGDRIQMRIGVVFINGEPVNKEYVGEYMNEDGKAYFDRPSIPVYRETLPNGVSYEVLDVNPNGEADNTDEYAVPPGHYFVMGDNRDNSQDSRYSDVVGFVPEENFLGPVVLRFWNDRGLSLGKSEP
ncbi:MAG: signal peptidase I [Hyphomicrobiales bacterium]